MRKRLMGQFKIATTKKADTAIAMSAGKKPG